MLDNFANGFCGLDSIVHPNLSLCSGIFRAERNRQSAAASRERKKRHLKELENQVRYLSDVNTALQYRSHVDKQAWNEKEKQLESEIAKLKKLLSSSNSDIRELRNQLEAARKSQS